MKVPFIHLKRRYQDLKNDIDSAFARVMESGRFVLGSEVDSFETEFAAYCGAKHCVGVGSGLDALSLALRAYDIGPGCEVIVPAHTFIATWLAVSNIGARPAPVDIDPRTYNIDPDKIERAITANTKAIIVVHLYGQPAEMEEIVSIAAKRGLRVIEDAAQAHGAAYKNARVGSLADAAAFSFYPTKNLGCLGDGGAVVTDDDALADKLRLLRNYGSAVKYKHEITGVNSRLDELQASFLRVGLHHLDEWNERRRGLANAYVGGLKDSDVVLPWVAESNTPVWHIFAIRVSGRQDLQNRLDEAGIDTMIHYPIPPHLQSAYSQWGFARASFPIAESACDELLSLPMDPYLTAAEVGYASNVIAQSVGSPR